MTSTMSSGGGTSSSSSSTSMNADVLLAIPGSNGVDEPELTSSSSAVNSPSGGVKGNRPVSVIVRTLSIPSNDPNVEPVATSLSVSKNISNRELTGVLSGWSPPSVMPTLRCCVSSSSNNEANNDPR